ncbi:MAG: di-heme oxidoredictase family protein [Pseudomonadota bacterium]
MAAVVASGAAVVASAAAVAGPAASPPASSIVAPPATPPSSRGALLQSAPELPTAQHPVFRLGRAVFNTPFEAGPEAPRRRAGLGPRFNAPSCDACHNGAGRGDPPRDGSAPTQGVVHAALSSPGGVATNRPLRVESVVGGSDARASVRWIETLGGYADRRPYSLRRPELELRDADPALGRLHAAGLRMANPLVGLGLLEAVPDATLAALADPHDRDGDGISGRVHRVRTIAGRYGVGRFGWKAAHATLLDQTTVALAIEMGVASRWRRPPEDAAPEIDDELVHALVAFQRSTRLPDAAGRRAAGETPARPASAAVARGERLFHEYRCAGCHVPQLATGAVEDAPWLANRVVPAYTDLLLHDLGPGLAAPVGEGDATATEWRTAPLWGLGLARSDRPRTFLHDGRARSVEEAILWHGGEAALSRHRFLHAAADDRAALLVFLDSL